LDLVALFVGNFSRQKRPGDIIKAMAKKSEIRKQKAESIGCLCRFGGIGK